MDQSATSEWTANTLPEHLQQMDIILEQLCLAFNTSPYLQHNHIQMNVHEHHIQAYIAMQPHLIGNAKYEILHGGVAATVLDSLGGIVAMGELYRRSSAEHFQNTLKQVSRLATIDMRVDYIAPGRGQYFIGSAEVIRLGSKSCTMRMDLHNDQQVLIATAIASYAF